MTYEIICAGFGGQGILFLGKTLAFAGLEENKEVSWIPSYGPEMRGGTAYCTVVISEKRIGYPIVTNPKGLCVFNRPTFDKFEPRIKSGGLIVVNSSLIDVHSKRDDIRQILVPANDMAIRAGNVKATNIAMLAVFVAASGVIGRDTLLETIKAKMGRKQEVLAINLQLMEEGFQLVDKQSANREKV